MFTDSEILELIQEPKFLPHNWRTTSSVYNRRKKIIQTVDILSESSFSFVLKLNQNQINIKKFSLVLGFYNPYLVNEIFRLKRYDSGHSHKNLIEKNSFNQPHIHIATERYQNYASKKEDGFAEPTDRFNNYEQALHCLFADCNIKVYPSEQLELFGDYYAN